MLFKLAYKNIRKSIKDYAIYFFTLVLGVAIFYVFNAMESSAATMVLSNSKLDMIALLNEILGTLSIFVSLVLGCLIVYASRFLMKRRKKEFGTYMLLGMSKTSISKILFWETCMIGILSLVVGIIIGVIASQFISLLVASMFEANMEHFAFTFSMESLIKTILYFGIIYVSVMVLYTFSVSKTKLITLLQANKQNEVIKLKKVWVSFLLFIVSIFILMYAYWYVTVDANKHLQYASDIILPIILGIFGTILFFYSLSGFILKMAQSNKRFYYKNVNMFVVRQIHSKANTTVISMSVICLMLFITICVFSSGFALNESTTKGLKQYTPLDVQMNLYYSHDENNEVIESPRISEIMLEEKFDMNKYFEQYTELKKYRSDELTYKETVPSYFNEELGDQTEIIVLLSEYNEIAKLYGKETFTLQDDEYIVLCDWEQSLIERNKHLKKEPKISIKNKTYSPKYNECKDGFIVMGTSAMNTGIYVLPDTAMTDLDVNTQTFVAKYKTTNDDEITLVNDKISDFVFLNYANSEHEGSISVNYKSDIYVNSVGLGVISTFIGLYLGIIFLLASAAVLALKELSESTDNKERYAILRKIGVDEKMINHGLATQIAIFFFAPLALAIVHSYFGVKFASLLLSNLFDAGLLSGIFITGVVLVLIYGGYFLITYYCSKNIIKEK